MGRSPPAMTRSTCSMSTSPRRDLPRKRGLSPRRPRGNADMGPFTIGADGLLRRALPRAPPPAGAGRGRGPFGSRRLFARDRRRALGGAATRPRHRDRVLRPCPAQTGTHPRIYRQAAQDPWPQPCRRPLGRGAGRCRGPNPASPLLKSTWRKWNMPANASHRCATTGSFTDRNDRPERAPGRCAVQRACLMADQLVRTRLSKVAAQGDGAQHFAVLNHLARAGGEKTPAQLAKTFHLTRGAMTNTLGKLEWAGHVHIRPDWDDARRKFVSISPSGRTARNAALAAITPIIAQSVVRSVPTRCGWPCPFCARSVRASTRISIRFHRSRDVVAPTDRAPRSTTTMSPG
jgi:DNA-binding MarR family transcriptional regulator